MSTAKIRNQHPTGTRVSGSLPRTAFNCRSSSTGSLTRCQARSESTLFNRENHSQWPQRWVTFLWRCQYKSGQRIWPKPSKRAWNPAMWRAPTRTTRMITKYSSSGIFPPGNFSTVVRQTEPSKIVAFNNFPTRWTVSAPGWRELGAGTRHSVRERTAPWVEGNFFPSTLLRKALAPHCCDFGWLIPTVRIHSCATLRERGLSDSSLQFVGVTISVDYVLDYGFPLFRLPLHGAILQLDNWVYNCV